MTIAKIDRRSKVTIDGRKARIRRSTLRSLRSAEVTV